MCVGEADVPLVCVGEADVPHMWVMSSCDGSRNVVRGRERGRQSEGFVRDREMIDMIYSLACHLLHSTRWQDDGIVLLINSKQI